MLHPSRAENGRQAEALRAKANAHADGYGRDAELIKVFSKCLFSREETRQRKYVRQHATATCMSAPRHCRRLQRLVVGLNPDDSLAAIFAGEQSDQRAWRILKSINNVFMNLDLAG